MTINFKERLSCFIVDMFFASGFLDVKKALNISRELKLPEKEYSSYSEKEKYKALKFFDKIISPGVLSLSDLDAMNDFFTGFSWFFKVLKYHYSEELSSLLEHGKLVDILLTVAYSKDSSDDEIQQSIVDIEDFFSGIGGVRFEKELEEVILKCREISLPQDKERLDAYVNLLIFSVFSHLDAIIHSLAFPDIKPICLGWLFMQKLDPSYRSADNGTYKKINKHKSKWTNPGRSLIKLMTALAFFHKNNEMPKKLYGEDLLSILKDNKSDPDDRRGNLIKRANEGKGLSFVELVWIWNDERVEPELCADEKSIAEMLSIMVGADPLDEDKSDLNGDGKLIGIWIVYCFFHRLYEAQQKRDKNKVEYHGYYYDYWLMFNGYYEKKQGKCHLFKWPKELVELAQPMID